MNRRVPAMLAASALALGAMATAPAASASPAQARQGNTSLAEVLTSDGNTFDNNRDDFDIVTEAVLAVLAAKPDSPVALLADGKTRLTVFAPTDRAFRLLALELADKRIKSEKKVFETLVDLAGVDTIEAILLYHVVPGSTLTSGKVLAADKARLKTANGARIQVRIKETEHGGVKVKLRDKDRNSRNPRAILDALDINKGNKQIAHAIDRVLRPIDL
ncbi:fasciclin domain-containing protein [Mycobacterium cookii]|uniref:Fasciclin domain-containing protein n=1 Tax=Nocardioides furvisabuli TaxID=375542 RepID=A0ABN2X636_9ACTN|nr:fasciclin domain-containing protein [Nocardioides furvisabuli]